MLSVAELNQKMDMAADRDRGRLNDVAEVVFDGDVFAVVEPIVVFPTNIFTEKLNLN